MEATTPAERSTLGRGPCEPRPPAPLIWAWSVRTFGGRTYPARCRHMHLHEPLEEQRRGYHLTALIKRWIKWGRTYSGLILRIRPLCQATVTRTDCTA